MKTLEIIGELKRCININFNRKLYYVFNNADLDMFKRLIVIELENLITKDYLGNMEILEIAVNLVHIIDMNIVDNVTDIEITIIKIEIERIIDDLIEDAEGYEMYEICTNLKNFNNILKRIQ